MANGVIVTHEDTKGEVSWSDTYCELCGDAVSKEKWSSVIRKDWRATGEMGSKREKLEGVRRKDVTDRNICASTYGSGVIRKIPMFFT